jgi:hypothetical protein
MHRGNLVQCELLSQQNKEGRSWCDLEEVIQFLCASSDSFIQHGECPQQRDCWYSEAAGLGDVERMKPCIQLCHCSGRSKPATLISGMVSHWSRALEPGTCQ